VTLFEYLSVAISIVLALSAGQILTNLREVLDPSRRYWVHALWVVHILMLHIFVWWSLWAYRDVQWNLGTFVVILLAPGVLFVCSSTVVPSYASSVDSWEDYFFTVRQWLFGTRSLFIVSAGFRTWLLLDKPLLESPTSVSVPMLALCLAGLFVSNRRFHGVLAVAAMALLMVGVSYFRLQAGAG